MSEVAIVTGGGNGIGRSVCLRFARAGIALAIVDRDLKGAESVRDEVRGLGGEAEAHKVDVTKSDEVHQVVEEVRNRHGRIDILCNIAGGSFYRKRIDELTWNQWNEVVNANLKGTFLFCREVGRVMLKEKKGRIVNTASNYGITGSETRTPYGAAKAGIIGFSKSLAMELAPHGILVNVIAPGPTDTPTVMSHSTPEARFERAQREIPLRRTGKPEDIAEGFFFFVGPESAYMTGQTLHVNGGIVMV
ncbi:MAG: SDR family oxidoreductase [Deltaproteobacteria bacterium]|nr:SDR family oxidoreductase [Deltaproteobacteria bacterium]